MARDQTKGPPRETVPRYNKHEFRHGRGAKTTSLNVRLAIETERPDLAKSRIVKGKSSPLRSETRQGRGEEEKRRGSHVIRSIVSFW